MAKVDWKKVVGTVAPTLATALGGPLAGVAVKAIAGQVLGKEDASASEVETAILSASPDTLLKLREAENAFETRMAELGIRLAELEQEDRASARAREVAARDSWTPRLLAVAIVIAWFVIQWFLLHNVIDSTMREIIMRTLGTLDMALAAVLAYYFGSSAGSAEKTKLLAGK